MTGDAIAALVSRFGLKPPEPYDQDWEICVEVPLETVPHMLEDLERAELDQDVRYTIGAVLLARFDDLFSIGYAWSVADIELRDVFWPRFVRALRSHHRLFRPEIERWSCAEATCEDEEFSISPHLRLAMAVTSTSLHRD